MPRMSGLATNGLAMTGYEWLATDLVTFSSVLIYPHPIFTYLQYTVFPLHEFLREFGNKTISLQSW